MTDQGNATPRNQPQSQPQEAQDTRQGSQQPATPAQDAAAQDVQPQQAPQSDPDQSAQPPSEPEQGIQPQADPAQGAAAQEAPAQGAAEPFPPEQPPSPYPMPANPFAQQPGAAPQGQPVPQPQRPATPAQAPYGQQAAGQQAPYGQQGTGQQAPYQPYAQNGYPQNPQAPQNPYGYPYGGYPAGQQPYPGAPYPPQQPKKKKWPWILGGCLIAFFLVFGGIASCVSCSIILAEDLASNTVDDRYGSDGRLDDAYTYDYDPDYDFDSDGYFFDGYTADVLMDSFDVQRGTVENGNGGKGFYEVGAGKDLAPGLYYIEGSPSAESQYNTFDYEGPDSYEFDDSVVFFGNYFVELEEGDAFIFQPFEDGLRYYPADQASFSPTAPYGSGLYRVGTDIPAGTYDIASLDVESMSYGQDHAAYVMRDLDFDDDSITQTKYVAPGSAQTVTVSDGEWLELYAAQATPAA